MFSKIINLLLFFKSQKVHIKLKTVNFKTYTRTRSLNNYTNNSKDIYEAAKYLLQNEFKLCKEQLKLRLIGVRVSNLKDKSIENERQNSTVKKIKIDEFFRSNSNYSSESIDYNQNQELKHNPLMTFKLIKCPHCDQIIEGNKEYINQHLDTCLNCFN